MEALLAVECKDWKKISKIFGETKEVGRNGEPLVDLWGEPPKTDSDIYFKERGYFTIEMW
jgi:hypothetical protein